MTPDTPLPRSSLPAQLSRSRLGTQPFPSSNHRAPQSPSYIYGARALTTPTGNHLLQLSPKVRMPQNFPSFPSSPTLSRPPGLEVRQQQSAILHARGLGKPPPPSLFPLSIINEGIQPVLSANNPYNNASNGGISFPASPAQKYQPTGLYPSSNYSSNWGPGTRRLQDHERFQAARNLSGSPPNARSPAAVPVISNAPRQVQQQSQLSQPAHQPLAAEPIKMPLAHQEDPYGTYESAIAQTGTFPASTQNRDGWPNPQKRASPPPPRNQAPKPSSSTISTCSFASPTPSTASIASSAAIPPPPPPLKPLHNSLGPLPPLSTLCAELFDTLLIPSESDLALNHLLSRSPHPLHTVLPDLSARPVHWIPPEFHDAFYNPAVGIIGINEPTNFHVRVFHYLSVLRRMACVIYFRNGLEALIAIGESDLKALERQKARLPAGHRRDRDLQERIEAQMKGLEGTKAEKLKRGVEATERERACERLMGECWKCMTATSKKQAGRLCKSEVEEWARSVEMDGGVVARPWKD